MIALHTEPVPTVLVLGGTGEGHALVKTLRTRFGTQLRVITSLAGQRAESPEVTYGTWRTGPFRGVEDLIAYLREKRIAAVLSATHPFSETIARNALRACKICHIPHLTLSRPPWVCTDEDRWVEVQDMLEAARKLPSIGSRAFLTIGIRALPIFLSLEKMWFLIRLPRKTPLSFSSDQVAPHRLVIGSGQDGNDLLMMRIHAIDVLVTKASGGAATFGKIAAARALALPVLMVRRPPSTETAKTVSNVMAAVAWVESNIRQFSERLRSSLKD